MENWSKQESNTSIGRIGCRNGIGIRKYKTQWAQNGGATEIDPFGRERARATGKGREGVPLPMVLED